MDLVEKLRPKRKQLVIAAEETVQKMFAAGKPELRKTQLNHLIGVCGEAACAEEIESYIRYQAGRKGTGWRDVAAEVIRGIGKTLVEIDDDRLRVEAYRLYAVFLTRAFTYRAEGQASTGPKPHHEDKGGSAAREKRR